MCNNSTSAGTSLEGTLMFAHVTLHRTLIPWGASAPGGKMRKQLLKDHNFLNISPIFIIESSTLIYLLFKKHCIQYISIWKIVLDLLKGTWHHNFMAGCGFLLWANTCSLWSGIKSWSGAGCLQRRSDVVGSSHVRLCHTCIIDVMNVKDTFCYLGDMLCSDQGCDSVIAARCCAAWGKFRKLLPVLTSRHFSPKIHGNV